MQVEFDGVRWKRMIREERILAGAECKNGPPWRSVDMNLVPGLGIEPRTRGFSIPSQVLIGCKRAFVRYMSERTNYENFTRYFPKRR